MSDKKRGAETQLVKDQEEEDVGEITEESFEPGIKKADAETLKGRRIVKARRPKDSAAAKPATAAAANPFAAALTPTLAAASAVTEDNKQEEKEKKEEEKKTEEKEEKPATEAANGNGEKKEQKPTAPANPFANFSFSSFAPTTTTTSATSTTKPIFTFGSFGSFGSTGGFGSIAASATITDASTTEKKEGGGLFGSTPFIPVWSQDYNIAKKPETTETTPKVVAPEVPTVTGEEDETTLFQVRAKLFRFEPKGEEKEETPMPRRDDDEKEGDESQASESQKEAEKPADAAATTTTTTTEEKKKEEEKPATAAPATTTPAAASQMIWKEKGTGTLRLKQHRETNQSRLIMRTDGSMRLILNSPLFPLMSVKKASDKSIVIVGVDEAAKPASYLIRVGKAESANELFDLLEKHKADKVTPKSASSSDNKPSADAAATTTTAQ